MFASKDIFLKSSGGYQISRSVRLRSSATAYFSRTPASAGNTTTFTWSAWVKRGALGGTQFLFYGGNNCQIAFDSDTLYANLRGTGATNYFFTSTAVFRDPSAWYHIVWAVDTTQATSTERVKFFVNGVQITSFSLANYPPQNTVELSTAQRNLGAETGRYYFDGYLTEVNFIDGQALTPSSFGETNSVTGVWQPKKYTSTYGTNGFYLNFSDNSGVTATTIGKDYSGNGNNWTPNNISVTAGATYDSMLDVPTPYADGGNGRGNYCTLNPLNQNSVITLSAGNLSFTASNNRFTTGTFAVTSGKWYWEFYPVAGGASGVGVGAISATTYVFGTAAFSTAAGYIGVGYTSNGSKYISGTSSAYGATYGSGNVIGVALDLDSGTKTITFYKDNISQGSINLPTSSEAWIVATDYSEAGTHSINFGQRPFTYTPPTGFVALNTQNLPTPTISNGAAYMAATTYTGNGTTQSITNTVNGVNFQPDLVWAKNRTTAGSNHRAFDSVRGASKILYPSLTNAEATDATGLTSFNSNGFSVGATSINDSATNFVAWQWNAGGSTVTNTSGTISSQVRANATAGFSVVTMTYSSVAGTVGHGLGVAPKMIIVKRRDSAGSWYVAHSGLTNMSGYYLLLESTAAQGAASWGGSPTSTVFYMSNSIFASGNYVAYCFAAVAGYSAFGSYTGNGSADGVFVYLGFRARFLMIKRTDSIGGWVMLDTARDTYNDVDNYLYANSSAADAGSSNVLDINSNGFKIRNSWTDINASGGTYIYAAFSEVGFKYALGR